MTTSAKDLRTDVPRSPYAEIGGFPWLPRLIDKVRALHAGTLGDYTPYPCGGDQWFLATVGVDARALQAKIATGADDAQVAAFVALTMKVDRAVAQRAFAEMADRAVGPIAEHLADLKTILAETRPDLALADVGNHSDLICVEEGHPLPARPAP